MRSPFIRLGLVYVLTVLAACAGREYVADENGVIPLVILPDTQFYAQKHPDIFHAQTRWIAEQRDALDEPFVMHLGDIVQNPAAGEEWAVASSAFARLEAAGVAYSLLPGNHDVLEPGQSEQARDVSAEHFPQVFSPARASRQSTWLGRSPGGYSEAHLIRRGTHHLLVLAIGWNPSAETLAWAQRVLDAHPQTPTLLSAHALVDAIDKPAELSVFGQAIWQALIAPNPQVVLAIGGHHIGDAVLEATNAQGQSVPLLVVDYQHLEQGGGGYLQVWALDLEVGLLQTRAYSPWADAHPGAGLQLTPPGLPASRSIAIRRACTLRSEGCRH